MKPRVSRPSASFEDSSPLWRLLPLLCVIWVAIYFVLYFSTVLPNNSQFSRLDVLFSLPVHFEDVIASKPDPLAPSGWKYFPQRLDLLFCGAFLIAASYAAGSLILRGLRQKKILDRPTYWAFAGGIGLSVASLMTLFLGLAGLLSQGLFIALFSAAIVAEGLQIVRDRRHSSVQSYDVAGKVEARKSSKKTLPASESSQTPRWLIGLCCVICFPFLLSMLLGCMLPSTDFDVKEYHIQGPKEYWQSGHIHLLAHNVYTSFPFLTEMLCLAGMVVRDDWFRGALVGQVVLMSFAPLTALGIYCVTKRIAGSAAGWLAATISLTTPWTYRISIIAYTEGAVCCYVILSLLAFLVWREQQSAAEVVSNEQGGEGPEQENRLPFFRSWPAGATTLILGFLSGSTVASKYPGMIMTAIPFAAALAGVLLMQSRRLWKATLKTLVVYGVGVLIAFGPWMAKNFAETRNPVYPLMYSVFGGEEWDAEMNEKWKRAHSPPQGDFFRGWKMEVGGMVLINDWQSVLLFSFAPLAFLMGRRRFLWETTLFAIVIIAGWFFLTHRLDRFWVPVNPVISVLAGCGLAVVLGMVSFRPSAETRTHFTEPRFSPVLKTSMIALTALGLVFNLGMVTSGLSGYNAYLMDEDAAWRQTKTPSIALIEALELPADSKVLFVGEAQVFDATFPLLYNTVFDDNLLEVWTSRKVSPGEWELESVDEMRQNLKAQGVTHVFVNWNEIVRYRLTYGYTDYVSPQRIEQLTDLGLWKPVSLPVESAHREWDRMNPNEQQLIEQWGPSLKKRIYGQDALVQFEMFELTD